MSDLSALRARPGRDTGLITGRLVFFVLIGFFGIVFAANAIMMRAAISTYPGTVVDSSYRASNSFGRDVEAAKAQAAMGWTSDVSLSESAGQATIAVRLNDASGLALNGLSVEVKLLRPLDRRGDAATALRATGNGLYVGEISVPAAGVYDLDLIASRAGAAVYKTHNRILLKGAGP